MINIETHILEDVYELFLWLFPENEAEKLANDNWILM